MVSYPQVLQKVFHKDTGTGNLWRKPADSACILIDRGCGKPNFAILHLNPSNMQIEKLNDANFCRIVINS